MDKDFSCLPYLKRHLGIVYVYLIYIGFYFGYLNSMGTPIGVFKIHVLY